MTEDKLNKIEEKMEKKQILEELDSYVDSSKIWQNKRFNSKSA